MLPTPALVHIAVILHQPPFFFPIPPTPFWDEFYMYNMRDSILAHSPRLNQTVEDLDSSDWPSKLTLVQQMVAATDQQRNLKSKFYKVMFSRLSCRNILATLSGLVTQQTSACGRRFDLCLFHVPLDSFRSFAMFLCLCLQSGCNA